jgi:23S rRNA pseudouridine1911/1915/1917 synthase
MSEDSLSPDKDNYPEYIEKVFTFKITSGQRPERIDTFLTHSIINATRTRVAKAIDAGFVEINGQSVKPSRKIQPGDEVVCKLMKPPPIELVPENIPLEIVFEDDELMVVNKKAGMVTHPGFGNRYGTLVNAVLYHLGFRESLKIELGDDEEDEPDEGSIFASDAVRPGVVHRLDKDTSGLIIVSKNPIAHARLAEQFADRSISRTYYTLVWGDIKSNSGTIEGDIGRSSRDRKLFAVVKKGGKNAVTDYEVIERYGLLTLLKVKLRTGRTHQIRVHFSHIKHPVFGDPAYGGDKLILGTNSNQKNILNKCLKAVRRQMLHAKEISFRHPTNSEIMTFSSDLPPDFDTIIEYIKELSAYYQ